MLYNIYSITTFGDLYMKRQAIIDIGSEAITLTIAELSKDSYRIIERVMGNLSLGSDCYINSQISEESINRLIDILSSFKDKCYKEYKVRDLLVFASSALREAGNRDLILCKIKYKLDLNIKILSNTDERIFNLAYVRDNCLKNDEFTSMDLKLIELGAGSLQLSSLINNDVEFSENIKLGTLRVASLYNSLYDAKKSKSLIISHITQEMSVFANTHKIDKETRAIIPLFYSAHLSYLLSLIGIKDNKGYHRLSIKEFEKIESKAKKISDLDLSVIYKVPAELVVVIRSTLLIMRAIINIYDSQELLFCSADLAVAYFSYCQSLMNKDTLEQYEKDLMKQIIYLKNCFSYQSQHGDNVRKIALALHEGLRRVFKLTDKDKQILILASELHDIGKVISSVDHAIYSSQLMAKILPYGLGDSDFELCKNVVANHSGDERLDIVSYDNLKFSERFRYLILLSILRIADALDASGQGVISIKNVRIRKSKLELTVSYLSERKPYFELHTLKKKSKMFSDLCDLEVDIIEEK